MRNRFIRVFSFTHVGALYRSTLHSACIRSGAMTKKAPHPGGRLGRSGGSGRTAPANFASQAAATLPPTARPTLSQRYSPNPCAPAFLKTRKTSIASRLLLLAQGSGSTTSGRQNLIGEARKNQFLCVADLGTYQIGSTGSVARLDCLDDVVGAGRGELGGLAAQVCDGAAELDLKRKPRQRLDQRGISGLLGNGLAKLPIARSISFHVSALQGNHGFKPLVQFVKVRRLVAREA